MGKLLVTIVALAAVGLVVAVGLGLWTTAQPDLNPQDRPTAVGYVDVSAEIPIVKSVSSCGATTTTTGTWPLQSTTTTYSCDATRGAFDPEIDEHLAQPNAPVTVGAQLLGLSVSSSLKVKVLMTAVDGGGEELAAAWSNERSVDLNGGGILQFAWGHLYLDASDQWITLDFEIWVQGTDRYPNFEMIDSSSKSFYFDGVNS